MNKNYEVTKMTEKTTKEEYEEVVSTLEFWKPETINDVLEGTYVDLFKGNFGEQPIIETADGKKYVTPSNRVLVNLLKEVSIGDSVRIEYLGDGKAKSGQSPPKLYKVMRKK